MVGGRRPSVVGSCNYNWSWSSTTIPDGCVHGWVGGQNESNTELNSVAVEVEVELAKLPENCTIFVGCKIFAILIDICKL